jgi:hypothetical protein
MGLPHLFGLKRQKIASMLPFGQFIAVAKQGQQTWQHRQTSLEVHPIHGADRRYWDNVAKQLSPWLKPQAVRTGSAAPAPTSSK